MGFVASGEVACGKAGKVRIGMVRPGDGVVRYGRLSQALLRFGIAW